MIRCMHNSMLDLVRRTCDGAQGMDEFEGEFVPDADEQEIAYHGEFRHVSKLPGTIDKMLMLEDDPVEREALLLAREYWDRRKQGSHRAGEPCRGEHREITVAQSMGQMAEGKRASHVAVQGLLRGGGIPSQSNPSEPTEYIDGGIIDWDHLLSMGPLQKTEDWF